MPVIEELTARAVKGRSRSTLSFVLLVKSRLRSCSTSVSFNAAPGLKKIGEKCFAVGEVVKQEYREWNAPAVS